MPTLKKLALSGVLFFLFCTAKAQTPQPEEEKEIRTAILNYVESFYKADTNRVHASVHTELTKRGYFKRDNQYREGRMTFRQMVNLSGTWSKTNPIPADAPKEITVFDIQDKTAAAKVKALWGTDYFHLVKQNGRWMILHVLWQDHQQRN